MLLRVEFGRKHEIYSQNAVERHLRTFMCVCVCVCEWGIERAEFPHPRLGLRRKFPPKP